jgi:uncharacterized protein (TIGR02145 family)
MSKKLLSALSLLILTLTLPLALTLSCSEDNSIGNAFLEQRKAAAGHITDPRDGKQYRTVKIGNVTWLAENLNYETVYSHCYDEYTGNGSLCKKYGRLYDWTDAMLSACPAGWHLPTDGEWEDLQRAVDDDMARLRSKEWHGGRDLLGWTALPGGYQRIGGHYLNGEDGLWWSATEKRVSIVDSVSYWGIGSNPQDNSYNKFYGGWYRKGNASMAVRCAKDDGNMGRVTVKFDPSGGILSRDGNSPIAKIDDITLDIGMSLDYYHIDFKSSCATGCGGNGKKRIAGWYDGDAFYNWNAPITRDMTLKAKWVAYVYVTFDSDGGSPIEPNPWMPDSGTVFRVLASQKAGHTLVGWFDENGVEYVNWETALTADVKLTARWRAVPKYTVSYDLNGGATDFDMTEFAVDSGSALTAGQVVAATRAWHYFEGWFDEGGNLYAVGTVITKDVTLAARWRAVPKYTVSFNTAGGTPGSIAAVQADSGSLFGAAMPANPAKADSSFAGWYDGAARYTAETVINKGVTLTARWGTLPQFTVTFRSETALVAGTLPSPLTRDSGQTITLPAQGGMMASRMVFDGWAVNGESYGARAAYTVSGNVAITAVWSPVALTPFTDTRDGKTYNAVKIGGQVWMAENLNFEAPDGSWCYGNSADSCNKYGRLYNWNTAMDGEPDGVQGICPDGWHLPSRAEWGELITYAGANAGNALKSTTGWSVNKNGAGTDIFGFAALPGGSRSPGGQYTTASSFSGVGQYGAWWAATKYGESSTFPYDPIPYLYELDHDKGNVFESHSDGLTYGISVRCVQD